MDERNLQRQQIQHFRLLQALPSTPVSVDGFIMDSHLNLEPSNASSYVAFNDDMYVNRRYRNLNVDEISIDPFPTPACDYNTSHWNSDPNFGRRRRHTISGINDYENWMPEHYMVSDHNLTLESSIYNEGPFASIPLKLTHGLNVNNKPQSHNSTHNSLTSSCPTSSFVLNTPLMAPMIDKITDDIQNLQLNPISIDQKSHSEYDNESYLEDLDLISLKASMEYSHNQKCPGLLTPPEIECNKFPILNNSVARIEKSETDKTNSSNSLTKSSEMQIFENPMFSNYAHVNSYITPRKMYQQPISKDSINLNDTSSFTLKSIKTDHISFKNNKSNLMNNDLKPQSPTLKSLPDKIKEKKKKRAGNRTCKLCEKKFKRPSGLLIHMNSHTGEKPFICKNPNCNKKYNVLSNLRRHLKLGCFEVIKNNEF